MKLKSKSSLILFVYNLMIKYSEQKRENFQENAFNEKKKRPRLIFKPGLALTGLWTTRPSLKNLWQMGSIDWLQVGLYRPKGVGYFLITG